MRCLKLARCDSNAAINVVSWNSVSKSFLIDDDGMKAGSPRLLSRLLRVVDGQTLHSMISPWSLIAKYSHGHLAYGACSRHVVSVKILCNRASNDWGSQTALQMENLLIHIWLMLQQLLRELIDSSTS